ncbi:ferritin-like domain-containing protein [Streptomyces sp. A012304]|uniref:ferritin-like domain-containing protein n=1 Tax=Streptomyces sp. A012304 TaxID=375446 RepID=UPI0022301863|nr:ferritin-like domain-containing protein [Streptomyces sp. A012304]GKQ40450.1 hypothetical protein ALMP_69760 [Streptomyces sp. A012304]
MPDLPAPDGKFFPRNLTARADYLVRGNPSGTRPESGVDNCFPGLEFDQRNLDTGFLPGLRVDFHRDEGARVLAFTGDPALAQGLTDADLTDERPLFVRAVCGRTTVDQTEQQAPTVNCEGMSGLDVWRHVHDLLPGPIAVVLGPQVATGATLVPVVADALRDLNGLRTNATSFVQRDPEGQVEAAVLTADRARYLDDDGVIDPDVYAPGELTRSLCAPWQYDFRDCGCFYWAASKPDVTSSADGSVPEINFLRRDRRPTPDLPSDDQGQRRELEFTWPEVISNWNVLPVVLDDREQPEPSTGSPWTMPAPATGDLLTPEQVADELTTLAGVEHALCVEYLYAHYSLDAPLRLPRSADELTRRAHAAGQEVFAVAVDEMRHLRWVNEALAMLGRRPVLDRAEVIERETDHRFSLEPLTERRLQWFVDVEAPSRTFTADPADPAPPTSLDGMYVRLHASVVRQIEQFRDGDRLAHLIKLIIDEGGDHYRRFRAVQRHLAGLTEEQYLRPLDTAPGVLERELLALSDEYYAMLIGALQASLERFDTAAGALMAQSRRMMTNMHEVNHVLARRGVGPRFTLPDQARRAAEKVTDVQRADGWLTREAAEAAARAREAIGALGEPALRAMVVRHQADTSGLLAALTRAEGNGG